MLELLSEFEHELERIIGHSTLFPGQHITADVIVNFAAGRLSSERRAAATVARLSRLTSELTGRDRLQRGASDALELRFHITHYVGHAHLIARQALSRPVQGIHLIVTAGGDGTHGETLSAYTELSRAGGPITGMARPGTRERLYFVRLPFGTGNDGADAPTLETSVQLLLGRARPARTGQIEVKPAGKPVHRGYNIASIGLDAYVAYLTNRLKRRFAGDLYKPIADVMTLLYERLIGASEMTVSVEDHDGHQEQLRRTFLLLAFGVSGYRQYGGGKRVLPGEENLCAIEPIGLIGKVRLKRLFYEGGHVHEPQVTMRTARRVTIEYDRRVPLQIDGETIWLDDECFPLVMEVAEATVPVLRYDEHGGTPE